MKRYLAVTLPGLLLVSAGLEPTRAADSSAGFHSTRAPAPATECEAHVAYDRDLTLPGYVLPTSAGSATCIPFTTVSAQPTPGYRGDFYVAEFTDARLRESNEQYIAQNFPDNQFGILMRVRVIEGETLTPDFHTQGTVLYQWPVKA